MSEDENSSVKMGQVFDRLRSLIDEFSISLIIVDHTGKDSSKGARGSSVKRSGMILLFICIEKIMIPRSSLI